MTSLQYYKRNQYHICKQGQVTLRWDEGRRFKCTIQIATTVAIVEGLGMDKYVD